MVVRASESSLRSWIIAKCSTRPFAGQYNQVGTVFSNRRRPAPVYHQPKSSPLNNTSKSQTVAQPETLRVGILGAGQMARQHARAIGRLSNAIVNAVVDPDPSALAEIRQPQDLRWTPTTVRTTDAPGARASACPRRSHARRELLLISSHEAQPNRSGPPPGRLAAARYPSAPGLSATGFPGTLR